MARGRPTTSRKKETERRRYYRIPLRGKLLVRYQQKEAWLKTVDFGFGGVFLETKTPLNIGTVLTLGLEQDDQYAETRARVVREDRYGMAVAFIEPPAAFSKLLIAVMEPHLLEKLPEEGI